MFLQGTGEHEEDDDLPFHSVWLCNQMDGYCLILKILKAENYNFVLTKKKDLPSTLQNSILSEQ